MSQLQQGLYNPAATIEPVSQSGTWVVGDNTTSVGDGRKTVTSAGVAETLAASTVCKWVIITAITNNTGVATIGGSTVIASLATRRGVPLFSGDSVTILTDNLADIYVDVTVSGEGVTYAYGI